MAQLQGWLFKRSSWGRHDEKSRWFVLDPNTGELSYYKVLRAHMLRGDDAPALGTVRLGKISISEVVRIDDRQVSSGLFDIVTTDHVHQLRAETPEVARRWVNALKPRLGSPKEVTTVKVTLDAPTSTYTPPSLTQPATLWSVEAVWRADQHHGADHHQDAELHLVADLGSSDSTAPAPKVNVLLSDGTTLMIDTAEQGLEGPEFHEVASAGDGILLARLRRSTIEKDLSTEVSLQGSCLPLEQSHGVALLLLGFAMGFLLLGLAWPITSPGVALMLGLLALVAAAAVYTAASVSTGLAARRALQGQKRSWKLDLKSVRREPATDPALAASLVSTSSRLSHPQRKPSGVGQKLCLDQIPSGVRTLPPGAVDFSGTWQLQLQKSDDPSEFLKALGVPWVMRAALKGVSRQVVIEHDGLEWSETMITPLIKKVTNMTLDGSPHNEVNPVDKSTVTMLSYFVEDGRCVLSHSTYHEKGLSQITKRYLEDDGKTYHVVLELTEPFKPASKPIHLNSYYALVSSS